MCYKMYVLSNKEIELNIYMNSIGHFTDFFLFEQNANVLHYPGNFIVTVSLIVK